MPAKLPPLLPACIVLGLLATAPAAEPPKPSPFEDALREAVKSYRDGEIEEAASALDQARAILDKAKADRVRDALPDPPEGWSADEMTTEDVPAQFGGGKVAKKLYKQKSAQTEVLLEIYHGSSFIKLLRGLYASDEVAKSQDFEIKRAGGEQVLVKQLENHNWEVIHPFEDDLMIKLTGRDGAEPAMMLRLIREVDRRSLRSLLK